MNSEDSILTANGQYFSFDLQQKRFDIRVIAHALSNICRFGGHTQVFYSVAEHSVRVSRLLNKELAMYGLLHDASEAYLGDVVRPLKRQLSQYKIYERWLQAQIYSQFGLRAQEPEEVKHADVVVLATEARDLMHGYHESHNWTVLDDITPLDDTIEAMTSSVSRWAFIERFQELGGVI